jgi:NADH-quinone oxidoreductase subunit G
VGTIHVDGVAYEVDPDQSLLQACLSLGVDLPYFCWHPAMGSVGACRQCAIKQFREEGDARGKIVMACMTPAAPGSRISIWDPEARSFRARVIEGLMLNHPHDCPVCDEGGECHLQDMTVMTGHDHRRTRFPKRTFRNQYLGPFVNHEMNRCIQCYRCVRFYREYAGGRDLQALGLRNHVYFGRDRDGVLENEFAGNLVEVCPTGVFTDATLKRHYTRKWDLRMAPAICVHCGLGCNITAGERYGILRRIINRYNGEVNGWFLCDRGRFGYEFVNSEARLRACRLRAGGGIRSISRAEGVEHLAGLVRRGDVIGIGSPRASMEANFALRALVGPERFFAGISDEQGRLINLMLERLREGGERTPPLREVEQSDAALILGEDPANSAPRLALALRQTARRRPEQAAIEARIPLWLDHAVRELLQGEHGPLFLANPEVTCLDDVSKVFRLAPDDVARLGWAVARELDPAAPDVPGLPKAMRAAAQEIAAALAASSRPLIVSGPSCRTPSILEAAAGAARALLSRNPQAALLFCAPECNSFGLGLLGAPALGPALSQVRSGAAKTVIVLENDAFTRLPAPMAEELLARSEHLIALDSLATPTADRAELLLPAATFAEGDGTLVSNEGRAQRSWRVLPPEGDVQESWRWLRDVMRVLGRREGAWEALDDIAREIASAFPGLAGVSEAAPLRSFRLAGEKVAREPHRCSGRTAVVANIAVSEPKPPDDSDSALTFTMEGYPGQAPAPLMPFFWWPGWNSIQATKKFQEEVNGPLRGGDGGVRLLAPSEPPSPGYPSEVPAAFSARPDEYLVVPLPRVFGSDEVSRRAPAVAQRVPPPSLLLNVESAEQLQLASGQEALLSIDGISLRLRVELSPELPAGVAGLPLVAASLEGLRLPAWSRIARAP